MPSRNGPSSAGRWRRDEQAVILRKGGIAERRASFDVEQRRFWLYPTYVHQQRTGVVEEALPLLECVEAERPPEKIVRSRAFRGSRRSRSPSTTSSAPCGWRDCTCGRETVQNRFLYREPGLFVLVVRVYRAAQAIELPETPEYAGCRSWVDLGQASIDGWSDTGAGRAGVLQCDARTGATIGAEVVGLTSDVLVVACGLAAGFCQAARGRTSLLRRAVGIVVPVVAGFSRHRLKPATTGIFFLPVA